MKIYINQMGYHPDSIKTAVLAQCKNSDTSVPQAPGIVQVCTADGTCVSEKETTFFGYDEASGDYIWHADFTEITAPGEYIIKSGDLTSYPFTIGTQLYSNLHTLLSKMLYFQRCGMELLPEYAGIFARPTCHLAPSVLWDEYVKCKNGELKEEDMQRLDIRGGWHDAGDYGRYSTAASVALAHILYAFRFFPEAFEKSLNIPESGNGIPDILNECLYELKWLLQMQNDEGGVYHKQCTLRHADFVMPHEDNDQMYLYPVSSMAVGDFAAIMALASRIYQPYNPDFAKQALDASLRSYDWLQAHPDFLGFYNPPETNTGEYDDISDLDERMWAAVELYRCTGEEKYLADAKVNFDKLAVTTEYGWADISGFAAWALFEKELIAGKADICDCDNTDLEVNFKKVYRTALLTEADRILDIVNTSGYRVDLLPDDFIWGSNMVVLNRAMLLSTVSILENKKAYADATVQQMDYILGINAANYSYISGVGAHAFCHPHNRVTEADSIEETLPGYVSGGPFKTPADETAKEVLAPNTPPMKCFLDRWECYSLNEITIYWNSPAIFTTAFLSSRK